MKKLAAMLVGGLGIAGLAASPASAGTLIPWAENAAGSRGYFQYDGDYVGTLDWAFDNKSAVTRWVTDYGRRGECIDSDGAQNGQTVCNHDLAESGHIRLQVCHKNYSAGTGFTGCSAWSEWISIRDGVPTS
ncbi:hypothetical protein [Kribbella sp. CA-247076]|uniref:hypothetical protein n=1 Tax=Kribbella sp. CA-247076 TaxID=3239941 RepID=UPI003D8A5F65